MDPASELFKYLDDNRVDYLVVTHPSSLLKAELALQVSIDERCIVQTILVQADENYWMAVAPGDRQIDMAILTWLLEVDTVRLVDASDKMIFFPECKVDPLPPFGNLFGFPVIADRGLRGEQHLLFSSCSPTHSIMMRWDEYERLVHPIMAEITERLHG